MKILRRVLLLPRRRVIHQPFRWMHRRRRDRLLYPPCCPCLPHRVLRLLQVLTIQRVIRSKQRVWSPWRSVRMQV